MDGYGSVFYETGSMTSVDPIAGLELRTPRSRPELKSRVTPLTDCSGPQDFQV